jgi:membrane dipeptidase
MSTDPAGRRDVVLDLHQDLLPHIELQEVPGEEPQTGWEQLRASPVGLVLASTFPLYPGADLVSMEATAYAERLMGEYRRFCSGADGFHLVLGPEHVAPAAAGESVGVLVHVEGVGGFTGPVEALFERWWERGCRSVGLLWNKPNGLGWGPFHPERGLTPPGRHAARWLDGHGMVVDLAHMGLSTFWDTVRSTTGPLIVSHANARALCDHPRNLDDEQLRAIGDRGGVVGVVLSTTFLVESGQATVEHVVDHIEHIAGVIGPEGVGIGSDFGGMRADLMPELDRVERLGLLLDALRRRGWSQDHVHRIAWANAAQVVAASLAKSPVSVA